jgi:D-glycero-D-manno-heptose 1,7-bisphosphate phosphatase
MTKALFLDRDGIINVDHGYVYKKDNFEFVDGIFELCRLALVKGYKVIVITNQAGIARGYYSPDQFAELTTWMVEQFNQQSIAITDVFYCPHHPNKGINEFGGECECRKPKPGMILQAQSKHKINLQKSVFVGDKISDMQAAQAAGINNCILVHTQYQDDATVTAHRVTSVLSADKFIE